MKENDEDFVHLNRDSRWPDFHWDGLELRPDGALQLLSVPRLEGELPKELGSLGAPDGPGGIAVDLDGTIYFSDPSGHRSWRIDGCDGKLAPAPCIGGKNGQPFRFNTPRGLLIPKHRHALFVVDSGNHRIQVFDLESLQLMEIWGQAGYAANPQPGSEPGLFDTPWTMAADAAGNIYVVDYGNRRIQKFNPVGELVPAFWETLSQEHVLDRPVDIAASGEGDVTRLYVIDQTAHAIFVFDADGHAVRDQQQPVSFGAEQLALPMGIAAGANSVYAGDNHHRRILKFRKENEHFGFSGEAVGYEGPVAALSLDAKGNLLVHTGSALAPISLAVDKGYHTRGILWSEPIKIGPYAVNWHRVQAEVQGLGTNAHLRLFFSVSDDETNLPPLLDPDNVDPIVKENWHPHFQVPDPFVDVPDLFIGETARYLWIEVVFSCDGTATPVLSQMRVEFNHETYLQYLPAIYSARSWVDPDGASVGDLAAAYTSVDDCREFLARFLSLFESFFREVEWKIAAKLPALFDPYAAPREFLRWLAGWLALELDDEWGETKQRRAIAKAFERYAWRGTLHGLRESLHLFGGVDAIIEEPILHAAWWSLPAEEDPGCEPVDDPCPDPHKKWRATENSILGVTTMLASAEPQGAVVGTTAILDQSHLITNQEFGAPLFEDVAHQFSVQVYAGQVQCAETKGRVLTVIEREKPAHAAYHLCVIEARMRVGFQARVGIDTVVAGALPAMKLGEPPGLGQDAALGGLPAGRIGERSQLGITTRVG